MDKDGIFQGDIYINWDFWNFCGPDCVKHEDTLTWKKDETVKMTLQYDNPLLWTGLKWYGILLACILLYSLILTAVLSAIGTIIVIISYNSFHYLIPVMMKSKLEKSELSIHLADKMDNMDRTWKWFTNLLLRMFIKKVIELSERVNENGKFVIRISCKVLYYLVIATIAYITTRDQGDYYAESNMLETHAEPAFHYKFEWFILVFFVMLM